MIENSWNSKVYGSEFVKLYKRQVATRDALRKWIKEVFGCCQDRINSLLQKIKEIQSKQSSREYEVSEQSMQEELSEWLIRSETIWRQKSKELWLKLGDKNSKFFHLSTIIRKRNNNVDAIKKEDGSWIYEPNQIRRLFRDYFINLFKEEEICFLSTLSTLFYPASLKKKMCF